MSKHEPGLTIDDVREKVRATWTGATGDERAAKFDALIRRVIPEYGAALQMTGGQVWDAIEARRDYCPANYYQECKFPTLDDVTVYKTTDAMMEAVRPQDGFRCPACEGISTDYQECNSGKQYDGDVCNWKSYGLFGTIGKGLRVLCADQFLANGTVHDIFMPIALEGDQQQRLR